jgi:hypothetical protein
LGKKIGSGGDYESRRKDERLSSRISYAESAVALKDVLTFAGAVATTLWAV